MPQETIEKTQTRCTGHCCRCFAINDFAIDLMKQACLMESFGLEPGWEPWPSVDYDYHEELLKIADMLVPLGKMTNEEVCLVAGSPPSSRAIESFAKSPEPVERFTCKHLQENGDCGIYLNRPGMCSRYPYEKMCEWSNCTSHELNEKTFVSKEFQV